MKVLNVGLLIIWLIAIFLFSSDNGQESSYKSDYIVNNIIEIVNHITGKEHTQEDLKTVIEITTLIVRKTAHILEYLILGILVLNVMKDYLLIDKRTILISLLACFIYAISDEIHQLFVSERSGQFIDVLIDTFGALIGLMLYRFGYLLYKKRKHIV